MSKLYGTYILVNTNQDNDRAMTKSMIGNNTILVHRIAWVILISFSFPSAMHAPSSNLASLKLEARGRLFQTQLPPGHPRFSTRASDWHSRVNATSLLHQTSSLRIAPLASHAFVELRCPNVAFKLLAITMIDSCHADTHPCPKQLVIRLHIMIIVSCKQ